MSVVFIASSSDSRGALAFQVGLHHGPGAQEASLLWFACLSYYCASGWESHGALVYFCGFGLVLSPAVSRVEKTEGWGFILHPPTPLSIPRLLPTTLAFQLFPAPHPARSLPSLMCNLYAHYTLSQLPLWYPQRTIWWSHIGNCSTSERLNSIFIVLLKLRHHFIFDIEGTWALAFKQQSALNWLSLTVEWEEKAR